MAEFERQLKECHPSRLEICKPGDNQLIAKSEAAFLPKRDIAKVVRVTHNAEGRVTDYYQRYVRGQCLILRVH